MVFYGGSQPGIFEQIWLSNRSGTGSAQRRDSVSFDIVVLLIVLGTSVVLLVTEWIRLDLVALLVLSALAVTGILTPVQALAGFSNPATITVWAMFILSAALTETGVADFIGRQVIRFVGKGEAQMIMVLMTTTAVLSAFMNNIGVAAMMLPVTMDIARKTGTSPSRLLMPLAYAALLGGLTTLIGTPPNLLAAEALTERGLPSFSLFDFTPVGGCVLVTGILFMAFVGRHLLPKRDPAFQPLNDGVRDLRSQYALQERTFVLRLPADSPLANRTLAESRIGSAVGMNVAAIFRGDDMESSPGPQSTLRGGDRLLVEGRLDRLEELGGWRELTIEERQLSPHRLESENIIIAEARLSENAELQGQATQKAQIRHRYGVNILGVLRSSELLRTLPVGISFQPGDRLLIQGRRENVDELAQSKPFDAVREVSKSELDSLFNLDYGLTHRIFVVHLPSDSSLAGRTLLDSRLGDALGLNVLGMVRGETTLLLPSPDEVMEGDDHLLVQGLPEEIDILRGLQGLEVETATPEELASIESEHHGVVEAMLAPRSDLAGETLRELRFRERYGLQVLAVWRHGKVIRSNLRDLELQFGDAILLQGPREKLGLLAHDKDLIALTRSMKKPLRTRHAPIASLVMAAVILPVMFGLVPISIAAIAGSTLMVVFGCITMEEAHRSIDWKSVFLIAGMLPLGTALDQTGAAGMVAHQMVDVLGAIGPLAVMAGLYLLTAIATSIIPTAALVVLMAPIVINTSVELGLSTQATMIAVAMAASASFTSPVSHPANLLVMGPGGYRFIDYVKVGVPLTILVMAVTMGVLPFFWPLHAS